MSRQPLPSDKLLERAAKDNSRKDNWRINKPGAEIKTWVIALQKTKKELISLCTPFQRVIDMQFRVSEEIQRMIVDEIDKKKKTKSQEQKE